MPIYKTEGTLTGTIEAEVVGQAQAYLSRDDMTTYFTDPTWGEKWAAKAVEHIEWKLEGDGHSWSVTAFATRELTEGELRTMSQWVSGQNSDGMGEGFEQQTFAEQACGDCEECSDMARGWGGECMEGGMISFDWKSNDCDFVRIK